MFMAQLPVGVEHETYDVPDGTGSEITTLVAVSALSFEGRAMPPGRPEPGG